MFETNTASCGGFPGISDSFGAALWGVDYGLQMAAVNFSGALFHVGGQSVAYNPFTREILLLVFILSAIDMRSNSTPNQPKYIPPMDCRPNLLLFPCRRRSFGSD
jgi:hypothetical protein